MMEGYTGVVVLGAVLIAGWLAFMRHDVDRTRREYGAFTKWRRRKSTHDPASLAPYNLGPRRGHSWWWWRRGKRWARPEE